MDEMLAFVTNLGMV